MRNNINKKSPIPLYYQVQQSLLEEIKSGVWMPNDQIPIEEELIQFFNVSRTTIRQAELGLVNMGYLYRVKGRGTYVAQPKILQDFMRKIETFAEQMGKLGVSYFTKLLSLEEIEADEELQEKFNIADNQKVISMNRLRYVNDEPQVIVMTFLHPLCHFILETDIEKEGVYATLSKNKDTKIFRVERIIEAVASDKEASKLLCVGLGSPMQKVTTLGYNSVGEIMEYSIANYRGDKSKFIVELYG